MNSKPKATTCQDAGRRGGSARGPSKRRSHEHYHATGVMGSQKRWGGEGAVRERLAIKTQKQEDKRKAALTEKVSRKIAREQKKIAAIQRNIETLEVLIP